MPNTSYGTPYVQSSDLVSGWPNASLNVANRIDAVSYAGNGLNAQTGTTYTLVVGDAGKTITLNNAAAVAVTLPQDSVANLPTGAVVNFYNLGAGTVTISAGAGATFQGGPLTAAQYGYAAVIKLSANTYGPFEAVPTTPGLVLVSPSSIANSGGTASASGGAVTFSGVSSISLNGCFTSAYENYRVVIRAKAPVSVSIELRLRAAGTDASGANTYLYQQLEAWSPTNVQSNARSLTSMTTGYSNASYICYSAVELGSPNIAQTTGIICTGGSAVDMTTNVGEHTVATAYDGLTIFPNTSTITGTLRVYGYRNS